MKTRHTKAEVNNMMMKTEIIETYVWAKDSKNWQGITEISGDKNRFSTTLRIINLLMSDPHPPKL